MPDYVLKHKNSKVGPCVLSLPVGATDDDLKAAVAAFGEGWSLDKSADPAEVPPGELPVPPAAASNAKGAK